MKVTLLRWMIGVSIMDGLIGVVALAVFLWEGGTTENFRNAAVMLGIGVIGTIYFARLLQRIPRLSPSLS